MGHFLRNCVLVLAITSVGVSLVALTGCSQPTPSNLRMDLSTTMVPDIDLDLYAYMRQENPSIIPGSFLGLSQDLPLESVAVWGVARGNEMAFAGAVTFSKAADATAVYPQVAARAPVSATLVDRTIYFVGNTAPSVEVFRSVVTEKRFKKYDNKDALAEIARLPDSAPARLAAVAVVVPSGRMIEYLKKMADANTAQTLNQVATWGRLQLITAGIYSSQPINVSTMMGQFISGSIWQSEYGTLASVKLGIPGFLVGLVGGRILEGAGLSKINVNNATVYQRSVAVMGRSLPVLIKVSGDHVFAAAGTNEAYSKQLIGRIAD